MSQKAASQQSNKTAKPETAGPNVKARLGRFAPLANSGPLDMIPNWHGRPRDWFDRWQWFRKESGLLRVRRITGPLKVLSYILRWCWQMQAADYAAVSLSFDEIQHGRRDAAGQRLDRGTGLNRTTVSEALKQLLQVGWIDRLGNDTANNHIAYCYRPRVIPGRRSDTPVPFVGLPRPKGAFWPVWNSWTDLTMTTDSETLILCAEYLTRHQWGWDPSLSADYDAAGHPVGLTIDELANGRLNGQGARYDRGTGYSPRAIRKAFEQALATWQSNGEAPWLVWHETKKGVCWYIHQTGMILDTQPGGPGSALFSEQPVPFHWCGEWTEPFSSPELGKEPTVPDREPTVPDKKTTPSDDTEPTGLDEEPTVPGAESTVPDRASTVLPASSPFIQEENLLDNLQSDNLSKQSPSDHCALNCDTDGDGIVSENDLRWLLRTVGIKDVKGTHAAILVIEPRVAPATIVGWSLAHDADAAIEKPAAYTAAVLKNDPADRDRVPEPFATFAALTPDVWTLFAEWVWRLRYSSRAERPPAALDPGGEWAGLFQAWRSIYGRVAPANLPFGLGRAAADRIAQLAGESEEPEELVDPDRESLAAPAPTEADGSADRPLREGSVLTPAQIWQVALGELQLQMPKVTFDTWVKPTDVLSHADGLLVVGVPNVYAQDWLQIKLLSTIRRILSAIAQQPIEVRFVVGT